MPAAAAENPPQIAGRISNTNGAPAIVLLDERGNVLVDLTRDRPRPEGYGPIVWSPDGSRIAYAGAVRGGTDIHVLAADGATVTRLTFDASGGLVYSDRPAWSLDGRSIAYVRTVRVPERSGLFRVDEDNWVVDADGSNRRRLTRDAGIKFGSGRFGAAWSPDGSRFAIASRGGIDVVSADGTRRRTVGTPGAAGPVWSPDGSRIAYVRARCLATLKGICTGYHSSVYAVGAAGGAERRLTGPVRDLPEWQRYPPDASSAPSWWPDGSRLFFERHGRTHVMNADGTCERAFGLGPATPRDVLWRPRTVPASAPPRCVGLQVSLTSAKNPLGLRNAVPVTVTVGNDGNEPATNATLTLRVRSGRGELLLPPASCRGDDIVQCSLPPIPPGTTVSLTATARRLMPKAFLLRADASAVEPTGDVVSGQADLRQEVLACDLVGTRDTDVILGTARRDTVCALAGNDQISSGAGNDHIDGGAGGDRITPGPGRDVALGGAGNDRIFARDRERDIIDCGTGRDSVLADRTDVVRRCERVSLR